MSIGTPEFDRSGMSKAIDRDAYFKLIEYEPHESQWKYHNSQARFRVPCCGRRFGKSKAVGSEIQPHLLTPRKRFWIVGGTYDLAEKEFRVVWDNMIIDLKLGRDKRLKKAYNKRSGEMFIEFPWQTRLECRSADHPENLVGEALDGIVMSEAAKQKKDTWERFLQPALSDRRGFADFVSTPEGFNWFYDEWAKGQNPDFPDHESWRFPSWENRIVYPGGRFDPEILRLEANTTPEWFLQEIAADFASFVGKIFPEWDETKHVQTVKFNPDWPNFIAFDWGYVNPLAAVEFQISPMDEIYVWREHYQSYTILQDHINILRNREQPEGYHLDMAFGDAADPEAVEFVSRHFVPCMALPEAKTNWRAGIDLIRSFMRDRQVGEADEYGTPLTKPAFFVDHNCKWTRHEINNYRSKEPIKGQNVPEMGNKVQDHIIDAIRYALFHYFELGCKHHLAEIYSNKEFTRNPDSFFNDKSVLANIGEGGFFTMTRDVW